MGTGTFRLALALAALALGLAACGGAGTSGAGTGAFSWLHAQAPPVGWRVATIASGAAMAYPPSWKRERSDRGTYTAVLIDGRDHFVGYVNLTPRQGNESLANWSSFRVDHNHDEGDRNIKRLAAASGLRFRDGRGTCVKDAYSTVTNAHFVEIACLVAGHAGESVIVAAAPPTDWARESATLERAIEAVRT